MRKNRVVSGVLGLLVALAFLSGVVSAASNSPVQHPDGVYWKRIGPCTWYGEDYETNSLSLLGGGWAYASAYFHTCPPVYWYDGKNDGGVFGMADLIMVFPENSLYAVETITYFDVMGAAMKVYASIGMPPGSV